MKIVDPKKIVLSRTDSIGDVALSLPLCGILKERFPNCQIIFLGRTYTAPILRSCKYIDEVWNWSDWESKEDESVVDWLKEEEIDVFVHVFPGKRLSKLVKRAGIPHRIGTSHRLYHRFTCNHRPNFTRKRSELHEAQLNTKLLQPFGLNQQYQLDELGRLSGFNPGELENKELQAVLNHQKRTVIFHPKSQGSAVEWPFENFLKVAEELPADEYQVFFTGTEKEATFFRSKLPKAEHIHDISGKTTLEELIAFIAKADVLVAASTGPLHIAGLSGIKTIGLFSTVRPIHAGRWKPLGNNVLTLEDKKNTTSHQPLVIDYRDVLQEVQKSPKKR